MVTCPSGHESASDDFCDVCGILIGAPALSSVDSGPGGPAPDGAASAGAASAPGEPSAAAEGCPRCGAPRDGQFCEDCGWNFAEGTGPAVPVPPVSQGSPSVSPPGPPPSPQFRPSSPPSPPASPDVPPAPVTVPADASPGPGDTRYDLPSAARPAWSATVTADRAYYEAVREATGPDADGIDFPSYCPERRFRLTGSEMRIGRRSASRGIEPEIDLTGPPADPGVSRLHAVLISGRDGTWSVLDPGSANGTLVNGSEIQPNEPVKLDEGDRVNLGAWTLLIVSRDN